MIRRTGSLCFLTVLLLSIACVFALRGTGNYEYDIQSEPEDSLHHMKGDSLPADTTDGGLDDEFDLLDEPEN